jgi:hypothetical protein
VSGNGVSELIMMVLAAVAQFERTLISERVKDTKRNLRRAGRHQGGKRQFGYQFGPDNGGRARLLIPDPGEQRAIEDIIVVNRALFRGDAAAAPPVKPEVLEAPGVVDAVDLRGQPFELRPAAVRHLVVEQDRADIVLDQLLLDLPDDLLRFSTLASADCLSIKLSTSELQ